MKQSASALIADLIDRTKGTLNELEQLKNLSEADANWRPATEKWSVLECIEHLNLYGDFYLPEIKSRIQAAPKTSGDTNFKSGILGNYFAKSMLPKEQLNKMKTFADKNPMGSQLDKSVLNRFAEQQRTLLDLLQQARKVNLTKTKTGISISNFIKLRLGDTFRVVVYHNQRHLVQAQQVLEVMERKETVS